MVDRAMFIDVSAAKDAMRSLAMLSNNLANVGTTGFRADYQAVKEAARKNQKSDGVQTRFYSQIESSYSNFENGPVVQTDRDLDVAISENGFIAVQNKQGKEGLTRAGNLKITEGALTTQTGDHVLGGSGIIRVPDKLQKIRISADGTLSGMIPGQPEFVTIDRIKLVNPDVYNLKKGKDGLFYLPDGETMRPDEKVKLVTGALEGSNVNPVKTLADLIELSRNFEMHTHLMGSFEQNASTANQILNLAT